MTRIANADMAAAWDGDEGAHWAAHEERYDDAVRRHHARLFAAADIATDARRARCRLWLRRDHT